MKNILILIAAALAIAACNTVEGFGPAGIDESWLTH